MILNSIWVQHFHDRSVAKNVTLFGIDMSSSVHTANKKKIY